MEFAREGQASRRVGQALIFCPGLPDHANSTVRCRHAEALLLPGPTAANATSSILFLVDQMRLVEANARDLGHLDVQFIVARFGRGASEAQLRQDEPAKKDITCRGGKV